MECPEAQAAISETLDGCAPDAATVEAAKQHCRDCADCATFVRALSLVKRAPLPKPPADLADRVMVAVRREAAAEQARAGVATAATLPATSLPTLADVGSADAAGSAAGAGWPSPIGLVAWIGAAAVLLIGVGGVTVLGIRTMSQGQPALSTTVVIEPAAAPSDALGGNQAAAPAAESKAGSSTSGTAITGANASAAPDYIVVNGVAYRLVGPSTRDRALLTRLGTTETSLGGGSRRARDVLGSTGAPAVYVEDDQAKLQEFKPLERTFEGRTYRLRSAPILAFGAWPTPPSDIVVPTSADGSPTFLAVGTDPSGVTIYRKTASTTAEGIAVAPGVSSGDPPAANPNWTWWTPTP